MRYIGQRLCIRLNFNEQIIRNRLELSNTESGRFWKVLCLFSFAGLPFNAVFTVMQRFILNPDDGNALAQKTIHVL